MFSNKEQALSTSELKMPIRAFSQIGASHVRHNKPNQDYGKYDFLTFGDEILYILSVSDGHGSERSFRSEQGSKIAVDSTIKALNEIFFKSLSVNELKIQSDFIVRRVVYYWKQEVKKHFDNNALTKLEASFFKDENCTDEQVVENIERVYGATLLLAVVTPSYVLYLQVGDGNIYTIEASGKPNVPFQADSTIIGNDTHSLCEKDAIEHIQIKIVPHDDIPCFVFLTTDGLPNSFATDVDFSSAVEGIYTTICEYGLEAVDKEIPRWLQEYTDQGSGDDITIAFYCNENFKINDKTKVVEEENPEPLQNDVSKVDENDVSEFTHETTYEDRSESTTQEVISEEEGVDTLEYTTQEIVSEVDREDISKFAEDVTSQLDRKAILESSDKTKRMTNEQSISEPMQHASLKSNETIYSEVLTNDVESPKKSRFTLFFKKLLR